MRAMGGDAVPPELYKGFLDLFTNTHEERAMAQAHAIAKEVFKETELKKCRRSLLIHNVDKWVETDKETKGYGLADRDMAVILQADLRHGHCPGGVPLGPVEDGAASHFGV
jgi:hypothetical protein